MPTLELAIQYPRDRFPRTVCACADCSRFCKQVPGMLAPGDQYRLAAYLQRTPEDLDRQLLASPGAIVGIRGRLFRVPTIVPARRWRDWCTWLNADGTCAVHPAAPFGCSHLDEHMSEEEARQRKTAALAAIMKDKLYQARWRSLWESGRRAPAPEELRKDEL
jgi:hypothetical protein